MKRKKTPVGLISVLVVSVVGLLIVSSQFAFYSRSQEEQMQEMQEKMQKEMAAKSGKQEAPKNVNVSKETQGLRDRLKKNAPKMRSPNMDDNMPDQPSVLKPENTVYVPVPNEAATSSQWYK
jgi:mannitol-specific phosphotransferase system IIBC component